MSTGPNGQSRDPRYVLEAAVEASNLHYRHRHIENNQVGAVFDRERDGFFAVLRLGAQIKILLGFKHAAEHLSDEWAVIHHEDFLGHSVPAIMSGGIPTLA